MKSIAFDAMATIYDETRTFDKAIFDAVLDYLVEKFPPSDFRKLFEPGIGTGRIAIPLAEKGYHVTGVDISPKMLKALAGKLSRRRDSLPLVFRETDVTALPFEDASFDIAVVVHLFHLVRNWKKAVDEVLRVLKPGAPLIMIATGTGMEIPDVNNKYRELCTECGKPARPIGLPGLPALREYLKNYSRRVEIIENRWKWTQKVCVAEALRHVKLRYYGMTRLVPEAIHLKAVDRLEKELKKQYGPLETEVEVPNQMRLKLVLPS
jgi:ubiquinone/menaquinone biosynthesis C-methylase UbiE